MLRLRLETKDGEFIAASHFNVDDPVDLPMCVHWPEADRFFLLTGRVNDGTFRYREIPHLYNELTAEERQGCIPCDLPAMGEVEPLTFKLETADGGFLKLYKWSNWGEFLPVVLREIATSRWFQRFSDVYQMPLIYKEVTLRELQATPLPATDI